MPSKRSTSKSHPILRPLMVALVHAGCATSALAILPAGVNPLPSNGVVKAGTAEISNPTATSVLVKQTSNRAVIEWNSFSLDAKNSLQNVGPSATSMTVYRVVGDPQQSASLVQPSYLLGQIMANNRLFLINPAGIMVGAGARIDVGSLVLSSKDLDPSLIKDNYAALMSAGSLKFNVDLANSQYGVPVVTVDPQATLKAGDGGSIMLIGGAGVRNQGQITVGNGGQVVLAAVGEAEVDVGESGFLTLKTFSDAGTGTTRTAVNEGTIEAPNGHIQILTFGAGEGGSVFARDSADTLAGALYEQGSGGAFNTGTILAQGSGGGQGNVELRAVGAGSVVSVVGTIDVSAVDAQSKAGTITLSGPSIRVGLDQQTAAQLIADGVAGGGQIHLDDSSATSDSPTGWIHVASGSVLSADAIDTGNGGTIFLSTAFDKGQTSLNYDPVARSDFGVVEFYGQARARGGATSGNGGSVTMTGAVVNNRYTNSLTKVSSVGAVDVSARSTSGRGGFWQVNAPNLGIEDYVPSGQTDVYDPTAHFSVFNPADVNSVLNQGGHLTLSSHRDGRTDGGDVTVSYNTNIRRTAGQGDASLTLLADNDINIGGGVSITSDVGPLNISMLADAAGSGAGGVYFDGYGYYADAVSDRASAQAVNNSQNPTQIATQGGDLIIGGGQASGEQMAGGVHIFGANIDTRGETQAGKVLIQSHATQASEGPVAGVDIDESTINASSVYVLGLSEHGQGVHLNNTTMTSTGGVLDIRGVASGAATDSAAVGVDIASGVQLNAGSGSVVIAGRGSYQGVRIQDLVITTSGVAGQQITLAGQSVGSGKAGIGLLAGASTVDLPVFPIRIHDAGDASLASAADLIVGGTAGTGAANALDLGTGALAPQFNITGRENFRPLGVNEQGQIVESLATAIQVGAQASGAATNFVVLPEWFNASVNAAVAPVTVIGSSAHVGQIGVANGALDGAHTITLQNQGVGSGGIVLGGNSGADTGTLSLLTAGNVSQTGAIRAQALNVIAAVGAQVNLTNPGNRFGSLSVDGVTIQSVGGQSLPAASASTGIPGYSTSGESPSFQTLAITTAPSRNQDSMPDTGPFDQPKPFELPQAIDDQRSDVYVRDHFNRPQVCTVASVSSVGLGLDVDIEPLTLEWIKVRRSPQLSSCSGVRVDSSCSAF